ncbi:MAG: hypothetical protein ACRD3Q_00705 [Terriglobales bacterium]
MRRLYDSRFATGVSRDLEQAVARSKALLIAGSAPARGQPDNSNDRLEKLMAWPRIVKAGTVTVEPNGVVIIHDDFKFKDAGCREATQLGMAWAVKKLGAALVEDMSADSPRLSARE